MTDEHKKQIELIKEQFKDAPQYFSMFDMMINQIKDDDERLTVFLNSILSN